MPNLDPLTFHLLAKPTGAICNLDCKYCFFLSKELLYPGSRFRMSEDLLETYLRQLFESIQIPEVTVAWQGGEPTLMGLDFFKHSIELVEKHKKPEQQVLHTIQTNGTKIDDEWAAFFKQHGFLVGLSVDGPRELHDAYRVDKGGKGSFAQVMRGWEFLVKHGVDYNILCTVHAANGDFPLEVYKFFRDELKAQFIQFIPIVERTDSETLISTIQGWGERDDSPRLLYIQKGDRVTERSVKPEQYGRFMCAIFDEWARHDVGSVYVQAFDVALGNWIGEYVLCVHSPTCGNALALEHNGDIYSCDHFVEPKYLLGNIQQTSLSELVESDQQRQFGRDKLETLPKYCQECSVRFACHGGCPKDRFLTTPDGEPGLHYLCAGYKLFFHHIDEAMRFMAAELRKDRAPANVMRYLTAKDAAWQAKYGKARPNDYCPCGSGKKFKRCHGAELANVRH